MLFSDNQATLQIASNQSFMNKQRPTSVYDPVPREDFWVKAQKTKNGEFRSGDVKEKAEKIASL